MRELEKFDLIPEAQEVAAAALAQLAVHHAGKPYHNRLHTLSVMGWASNLARHSDLDDRSRSLVVVAAAYHDYIHDSGNAPGDNERLSARYAHDQMVGSKGFWNDEITRVVDMIEGTIIERRDGRLTQQAARSDRLEERIVADADLSMLGSPFHFLDAANKALLREKSPGVKLRGREMFAMLGVTLELLEQEPLTDAAKVLLPHRQKNYQQISILRQSIAIEIGAA